MSFSAKNPQFTISDYTLADLGVYFTANNAATGVATAAAPTAYSDTAPLFTIANKQALGGSGPSLYLDWIRLYETAAGTGGVSMLIKTILDQQTPTSGTVLTPKNTNPLFSNTSAADPRILSTGVAQTGNSRVIVGNQLVVPLQTTPIAVNTVVNLTFGGVEGYAYNTSGPATAAVASQTSYNLPPHIVPPGWAFILEFLITTQSAASSWAVEAGWFEG